ncbi:hypothetical protein, partial [Trinickia sp.]|uniref:hypothetical protein n=1 Tax=Trinickia sp. TaxID=2571163 RepID=UPI003F7D6260
GSAVILVNRQSNLLADFPGLSGAQYKLWYSYILWHELGHTFESDLKEAPTNPLFDKKKNPKNYQLYKEAHADIFALVGLARVEKGDVPALDRTGYEQFMKELIAWRRRSTDSIHATAPFLAQVTWEDIQATTESCMAESGGCRNEYAVSLDILEKVINRTRKMVHTAAVFRRT